MGHSRLREFPRSKSSNFHISRHAPSQVEKPQSVSSKGRVVLWLYHIEMAYYDDLERAFSIAKAKALGFIECHNGGLKTDACETCGASGNVPGLPCPECSHASEISWAILMNSEFGYEVVALNNRKHIFAQFNVDA